jgi:hypothetical protein
MKQILHIFAKDSRHFWPEIVVSLAITAAFTWIYPNQWTQNDLGGGPGFAVSTELRLLTSVLTLLVPVSWWLLIARHPCGEPGRGPSVLADSAL